METILYAVKRNLLIGIFILSFTGVSTPQVDAQQESKFSNPATTEDILIVRVWEKGYGKELLELAMEKTIDQGPYKVISLEDDPILNRSKATFHRLLKYLEEGDKLHVHSLGVAQERLERFIPIKVPILRGSLGLRLFLIHKDRQAAFSKVETLDDIRNRFIAGFGSQWADFTIFKANNLKVIGYSNATLLPKMLAHKRFDYFPLGAGEVWDPKWKSRNELAVERYLAFYYVYPSYFFVSKKQPEMANRIKKGLHEAVMDGTFNKLFFKYHGKALKQADLANRKIFKLHNPNIPKGIPAPEISWVTRPWKTEIEKEDLK